MTLEVKYGAANNLFLNIAHVGYELLICDLF